MTTVNFRQFIAKQCNDILQNAFRLVVSFQSFATTCSLHLFSTHIKLVVHLHSKLLVRISR